MSYKHNNLMAMRHHYWYETDSSKVMLEKQFLQQLLIDLDIYPHASLRDAEYLFFSLPSIIIVKAYALGFQDELVKAMLLEFIDHNRQILQQKGQIKVQYRM